MNGLCSMRETLFKISVRGTYTLRQKLENKEKFLYSEAKDKSSSTDADNSKLDKGANDDKGTNTNGKNADKGEDVNTDRNGKHANTDSKGGEGASIKNNKGEGIYDSDRSYNTEEEDQYLSSLFDNYELHRRITNTVIYKDIPEKKGNEEEKEKVDNAEQDLDNCNVIFI
ncbi:hypothetical protein RclHR1_14900001 [Rhizophagus clarus]|uniref:Uncharacterized protein n=1 Tax=Rhizophagus clarus TaxID=94130 RepID=A0A2Z6QRA4_9GLOM|nr:hypothetical protein RclHR1_14900001 [Rhizophagus clarus]